MIFSAEGAWSLDIWKGFFKPTRAGRPSYVRCGPKGQPVRRTGREKRLDYVGLLKVKTPANVGQNSNSAHLFDVIHNPT
jgi:hypothetical protein